MVRPVTGQNAENSRWCQHVFHTKGRAIADRLAELVAYHVRCGHALDRSRVEVYREGLKPSFIEPDLKKKSLCLESICRTAWCQVVGS
jgi:hypothetical protein